MPDPSSGTPAAQLSARRLLPWCALAVLWAVLTGQLARLLSDPAVWPPDDFVEYWAAGRLNAAGENPYDPGKLLPLQRAAGRDTREAVMMWNPPWTLPWLMPLGLLPARVGQLVWLALGLAAVVFCADWAWRFYGGPARRRWVAWALALTFLPTLFVLQSGQIGPAVLLGVVGFLHWQRRGRRLLAGAATVLIAIKPHLAYLFWVALLLDALYRRRWTTLLGGALAGLAALGVALACNPSVVGQYRQTLGQHPPEQWVSPTPGTFLRMLLGEEQFWLQFVPPVVGLAWLVPYWWQRRRAWDWAEQVPLLLLVSFVTASYGAWPFDLVVLLVPVVQAAALVWAAGRRSLCRLALGAYLLVDGLGLALNLLRLSSVWFFGMTVGLLVAYLAVRAALNRAATAATTDPAAGAVEPGEDGQSRRASPAAASAVGG
jgi:hypothetical protein